MTDPTPLEDLAVNDRFWLGYARSTITDSAKNRLATADKLVAASGWFWTVYSTVAVVGVAVSNREFNLLEIVLIVLPIPALAVAYFLSVWAASTIESEYDPRVPDEVEASYAARALERSKRILVAMVTIGIAALLVVVAGIVAALSTPTTAHPMALAATRSASNSGTTIVAEVYATKSTPVAFQVTDKNNSVIGSDLVTTDDAGRAVAHMAVTTSGNSDPLTVLASWTDDKKTTFSLKSTLDAKASN